MITFLLDVNVLIALIDPKHTQHDAAHEWFAAHGQQDSYLLALACAHGGKLATFDRCLTIDAVRDCVRSLHLIG